jgi:hypothetical protein
MSESQEAKKDIPEEPRKEMAAAAPETGKTEAAAQGEPKADVPAIEAAPAVRTAEPPAPARRRSLPPYVAQAAALACALGLGWAAGHATSASMRAPDSAQAALLSIDWKGVAAGLQKAQGDSLRTSADVQVLKNTLAGLKDTVERARQEAAGRFAQVSERLDRAQKTEQEMAARLAAVSERDAGPRLVQVIERLDRMEKQAAAQAAAKPAAVAAVPPEPLRTGSIPEAKPVPPQEVGRSEQAKTEAKPVPIEGWVLREVYDGVALIEGRNRRLYEIAAGQSLPGIGKVEAIEKRGRAWVVVTSKGIITSQAW